MKVMSTPPSPASSVGTNMVQPTAHPRRLHTFDLSHLTCVDIFALEQSVEKLDRETLLASLLVYLPLILRYVYFFSMSLWYGVSC